MYKKKLAKILSVAIMSSVMFTGCSSEFLEGFRDGLNHKDREVTSEKQEENEIIRDDTPEKAAKDYYRFYVRLEGAFMLDRGMDQADIDATIDATKKACKEELIGAFKDEGIPYDEEQLDGVIDVLLESYSRLTYDTEVISSDNDSALVKIKTTYFDYQKLIDKVQDETIAELKNTAKTEEEVKANFASVYLKYTKKEISEMRPSVDKNEQTYKFVKKTIYVNKKQKEVWVPEDLLQFQEDIDSLTTKV